MFKSLLLLLLFLSVGVVNSAPYVSVGLMSTEYGYEAPFSGVLPARATGLSLAIGHVVPGVPWLSGELEYGDFGEARSGPLNFKASGLTAWAVGDLIVGSVSGMPVGLEARVGATSAEAEIEVGPFSVTNSDVGLAYGTGIKVWVSPNTAVGANYRRRDLEFIDTDYSIESINLLVTHRF